MRRVLKPNGSSDKLRAGRFLAATNGADHMREIKELAVKFAPETARLEWPYLTFLLENGRSLLSPFFEQIDLLRYEDSLEVTAVQPLLAYIQSMSLVQALGEDGKRPLPKARSWQPTSPKKSKQTALSTSPKPAVSSPPIRNVISLASVPHTQKNEPRLGHDYGQMLHHHRR
ncbi:MAG: hypothetical protein M5U34_30700 [Chloroflexi bacterium]|nr:hypothetical protein [Chloroflexota bacterium]